MKTYNNPDQKDWPLIIKRPISNNSEIKTVVKNILQEVKEHGDKAVKVFALEIDKFSLDSFLVPDDEIDFAKSNISTELKNAIEVAKNNITKFHQAQLKEEAPIETMQGVTCWRKSVAISRVGLYIPGGTAPLFSTVLMLAIPAQLAGCKEIILCTPSKNNEPIHAAILYTAQLCGITKIYKIGGAAAIAAMAYGTESIKKVFKIFGPGNSYVTIAKQLVQQEGTAIDMPAGPSEVCVYADETAVPAYVAADLLSQAEHGVDSQVLLVCSPEFNINALQKEIEKQLKNLPRKNICEAALQNSKIIIVNTLFNAIKLINEYAPEHLILSCANYDEIISEIENAGSIFLGNYSPESVGDYASGTNHTLPTNGFAKQYSGVSVDSFLKKITYQKLTEQGLKNIANTVITMAEAESLQAHSNAIKIRLEPTKLLN
jgi:histidinol dehydrogenase